jgi:hypothetical protein
MPDVLEGGAMGLPSCGCCGVEAHRLFDTCAQVICLDCYTLWLGFGWKDITAEVLALIGIPEVLH